MDGFNATQLSYIGEKIFFDRYAFKDAEKKNFTRGDLVIVEADTTNKGSRELGTVEEWSQGELKVRLRDDSVVTRRASQVDKPLEKTQEALIARVARGAASVERPEVKQNWENRFREILADWNFVPGGRILAACGTEQNLTYFNCFVVPQPKDSRDGIIKTLENMFEIMSRGGGVGINLSTLRPRYSYVKGVNGRSSGGVSWGALYSFATGLIEQGGSRRGALMLILQVWHPDIVEFVDSKREAGKITNANISVGVTDAFMKQVECDGDWDLVFPDTSDERYQSQWKGDIEAWRVLGGKVVVHKTVRARELWNQIIDSAWSSAEPGIWFVDRTSQMSNSWYYPEGEIVCTNPCGEQPLPGWSVCNLGHVNLSRMMIGNEVDFPKLSRTVKDAVRFLDNVIDASPYFFAENENQQKIERRVGLGTVGLAEMLVRAKIRYGTPESITFIDKLYAFIAEEAYLASVDLAKEKGAFSRFDADKYLQSGFMQKMPERVRGAVKEHGIRNVTLLTQAPTGTVGTMIGTSTGIEPFYSWSYFRKSRLGTHEEKVSVVNEWNQANPNKPLPDYFVNALELKPEEHVRVQAAIQRWVDSAISKTCNVPSDYTVEQTRELYEMMFKLGCKGGTIYRDQSRSEQVLNAAPTLFKDETESAKVRPRPYRRQGVTISKETPAGTAHITMNADEEGRPLELFVEIGKAGSDLKAMAEGLGRLCSLFLRVCSPLSPFDRVSEIVGQLRGIGGNRSLGFGKARVRSLPDALAQALEEEYMTKASNSTDLAHSDSMSKRAGASANQADIRADLCPSCGNTSLVSTEGCQTCSSCGYSEC